MTGLPTILFVDDEPAHLKLCKTLLRREWNVVTAENGAEALAKAAVTRPLIAVVDHRMPGMTGTEMLSRLKTRDSDCVRILLTAYSDRAVMQEAINEAEVYRFFTKPVGAEELRLGLTRAKEYRANRMELRSAREMALLGGLCRLVAHDLNNVITPIMHAPDVLRGGYDDETLDLLGEAVDNLAMLGKELRAISHGRIPTYIREPHDITVVLEKAMTLAKAYGGASVRYKKFGTVPLVSVAPQRCFRLFYNLLVNAMDASPEGGTVDVRVGTQEGFVLIEVEDEGPGIEASALPHIFDTGFSTKGSSGLGLAICKIVAEGHEGKLEVLPRDRGAAFRVRLPVA
jgi:signal transduction histidine kinase